MARKTILIDGREVKLRATAALPRLYRIKFGRDVLKDILKLRKSYVDIVGAASMPEEITEEQAQQFFDAAELELFEDIAYCMAWHADNTISDSPDEWLEGFETFSIYAVLPEILSLWMRNEQTTVESKKKLGAAAGN